MKFTAEYLYHRIIQGASLNAKIEALSLPLSEEYIEGIVWATAQLLLDSLKNQGLIEHYVIDWRKSGYSDLTIRIQRVMASSYVVHKIPSELFTREMMIVAGVMMV